MPPPTRYVIHEGSIDLPDGFEDHSTNIFVPTSTNRPSLNLNIARDTLEPGEDLSAYVARQIQKLEKHLRNYRLIKRQAIRLGSTDPQQQGQDGEQIEATHKQGQQTFYQRQAVLLVEPQRALIFSGTSTKPFAEAQDAFWQAWLASFRSA